jgi:phage shock protein PspC (stress-responsive transcriptional regulator)
MKLSDERLLAVAIGVGGAIAFAIIGYLLQWISS